MTEPRHSSEIDALNDTILQLGVEREKAEKIDAEAQHHYHASFRGGSSVFGLSALVYALPKMGYDMLHIPILNDIAMLGLAGAGLSALYCGVKRLEYGLKVNKFCKNPEANDISRALDLQIYDLTRGQAHYEGGLYKYPNTPRRWEHRQAQKTGQGLQP
ncbi:MAG: hypothetical protein JWM96_537 [Alphaproteobacteria bacterium]|nr:hypothetical protein [Alphaproteobacteria bacterium]